MKSSHHSPVPQADNPTRAFIQHVVETGTPEVAININPGFASLNTIFLEGEKGDVRLRFATSEKMTQGNGVISGGAIASMVDSAIAFAVLSALTPGHTCSTISITINMQRASQVGDFTASAKVDKLGKRVAFATSTLFDALGNVVATAISSLAVGSVNAGLVKPRTAD